MEKIIVASETAQRPAGVVSAGGILDRIVDAKMYRLQQSRSQLSLDALIERTAQVSRPARPFAENLKRPDSLNIVAEIKQRSPSKGIIRGDFEPLQIARSYTDSGAAAISVLCE